MCTQIPSRPKGEQEYIAKQFIDEDEDEIDNERSPEELRTVTGAGAAVSVRMGTSISRGVQNGPCPAQSTSWIGQVNSALCAHPNA